MISRLWIPDLISKGLGFPPYSLVLSFSLLPYYSLDGITYTEETITWTIPKQVSPLLIGAGTIKELHVEMGVDLYKLSTQDIKSRGYMLASNKDAIIVKIPIGALGGNYKVGMGNFLDIKSYCR